ncbi:MAG: hypothetical protein H6601_06670 [Flavobacteriales bacterium]|nr:hypothetical protein [Flavobacteriales bacterium]
MQNEQILSFTTPYILPYGRGLVFVAAWEEDTYLHCERFVFFEGPAHGWKHGGALTKMRKADFAAFNQLYSNQEVLEAYMDCEGRQLAESELYTLFLKEASYKVEKKEGHVAEITLSPSNYISDLLYIKSKYSPAFSWLHGHTKSDKLAKAAQLVRAIQVRHDMLQ